MAQFNTLNDIKSAVRAGEVVHWKNEGYHVHVDSSGHWSVVHESGDVVSLFHVDNVTSDYDAGDFFII